MMKRNLMRYYLLPGQRDSGFSNAQELEEKNPVVSFHFKQAD